MLSAGSPSPQRIAVLGASGMLGTAITRELVRRPVRLRLVGRRPAVVPAEPVAEVEVCTMDLTGRGAVTEAVAGADTIIHLVAHMTGAATWRVANGDPVAERVNVGLVQRLIDAVRAQRPARPPIVVFAGSMSQVGGSASDRIDGSEADQPLTAYDRQKLAAEQAIVAATREGTLRGITLRLATLYSRGTDSPTLDRGVVSTMVRRASAQQALTMWHDGEVTRDLLCVDDAARAFVAAMEHADALVGRHWPVGTGQATRIADLFTMIAKVVATASGRPPVPVTSVPPAEYSMPTDLMDFVVEPAAFQRATGWLPRTQLADGLVSLAAAVAREAAGAAGGSEGTGP